MICYLFRQPRNGNKSSQLFSSTRSSTLPIGQHSRRRCTRRLLIEAMALVGRQRFHRILDAIVKARHRCRQRNTNNGRRHPHTGGWYARWFAAPHRDLNAPVNSWPTTCSLWRRRRWTVALGFGRPDLLARTTRWLNDATLSWHIQ